MWPLPSYFKVNEIQYITSSASDAPMPFWGQPSTFTIHSSSKEIKTTSDKSSLRHDAVEVISYQRCKTTQVRAFCVSVSAYIHCQATHNHGLDTPLKIIERYTHIPFQTRRDSQYDLGIRVHETTSRSCPRPTTSSRAVTNHLPPR